MATLTTVAKLRGPDGDIGATVALGNVTGSLDLSVSVPVLASQIVSMTLTGNTTITALPAPPVGMGGTVTLRITQDATGGRTLAVTGARCAYGVAPLLSTAAGAVDLWHLLYDGIDWWCLPSATAGAVPAGWA